MKPEERTALKIIESGAFAAISAALVLCGVLGILIGVYLNSSAMIVAGLLLSVMVSLVGLTVIILSRGQ